MIDQEEQYQKEAESYSSLGAEYFAARDIAQRYMAKFEAEHFYGLLKVFIDRFRDEMWNDITAFFLSDAESNLASEIRHRVEYCIQALLTGNKSYITQFVLPEYGTFSEEIRAAVAKHIPEELRNRRIADLEKELERVKEQLKWSCGRYE